MKIKGFGKILFLFGLATISFACNNSLPENHSDNKAGLEKNGYDSILLKKRVLVLNAYHEGFHWTDRIMNGIKTVCNQNKNIELFINYMDSKRCSDSLYFDQLKNMYSYKYKQVVFDAIISTDDHALDFLLNYRDSIFPRVPAIFCGINDYKPSRIANHHYFTGVHESYDVDGTIKLILKFHPNTKEIAIISDATLSGKAFNDRIKRVEPNFKDVLSFKYLTNLSPTEITQELQSISKETVLIWSIYIRKPDNTVFTSEESIQFIASHTSQPVYCVWDVVGKGVVGGKITDPFYQGKRSAEMMLDILQEADISKIRVEGSPLVYKFDYNLIKKFNISESLLPDDSIIINKPFSFYEANRGKIIGISALIIFLLVVIIILTYLFQKQKHVKLEISNKNKRLEETRVLLEESNARLKIALDVARKSQELEKVNKKLRENERIQQQLNKELRVLNLTKDKFFAIIAHDLRSPFNSILGISEILEDSFDSYDTEQQKFFLSSMNATIQNTYKLLENLLLWSRSQLGNIDFKPEEVNLYYLTNETIELLEQAARNKSISLLNKIPDNIYVDADKDLLLSIIRNLVSNAIKFTKSEGEVVLNACVTAIGANQKVVKISVKDNGVGIPKDMQLKLFDISESTSTKGTQKEAGTGLGLILCKEFVEKHNGKLWVESKVGKGSEFIFTIPFSNKNRKT